MSTFEINKIFGAAVAALLIFLLATMASETLFHVEEPDELAFAMEIEDEEEGGGEAAAEPEASFAGLLQEASAEDGAKVFRKCAACHKLEEGANAVGPSLWNVVGREVGAVDGFNYSGALSEVAEVWSFDNLNGFLEAPKSWAPGTSMGFAGLDDAEDRADVILYINESGDAPEPLPAVEEAPAEEAPAATAEAETAETDADAMETAEETAEGVAATVTETVSDAVDAVAETASDAADAVAEAASDAVEAGEALVEDVAEAASDVADEAAETARDAADAVIGATEDAADAVAEAGEDAVAAGEEAGEDVAEAASNASEEATETAEAAAESASETAERAAEAAAGAVAGAGAASAAAEAAPAKAETTYREALAAATPAEGEQVVQQCLACHMLEEGQHGIGPSLYGVVGRPVGAAPYFPYSDAVKELGGDWTLERLDAYLSDPDAYAPGNFMAFHGLENARERAAAVVYLNTLSDDPIDIEAALSGEAAPAADGEEKSAEPAQSMAAAPAASAPKAADEASTAEAPAEKPAEEPARQTAAATTGADEREDASDAARTAADPEDTAEAEQTAKAEEPKAEPAETAAAEPASKPAAEAPKTEEAETAEAPAEQAPAAAEAKPEEAEETQVAAKAPAAEAEAEAEEAEPAPEQSAEAEPAASGGGGGPLFEGLDAEFASLLAAADAEAGAKVFRKCGACHKLEEGKNAVGPYLHGVIGREVASVDGFRYSDAVAGIGGIWSYQKLNEYLTNPRSYAKGTKMAFAGLRKAEDRANVIAYINEADGSPEPLTP